MTKTKTSKSPKIEVKYYLFIDSASNKHLYFMNFSDTAKFVAKSGNSDLFSKYGGWNLYSKAEFEHDKMERMADTIIDGKRLSRYNLFKARGKDHLFNFIVYGSCFEKNLRILYLPSIAKRIGCPIVRMDTYYNGQLTGRMDIEYVSNRLSAQEINVFRAWQKRAK